MLGLTQAELGKKLGMTKQTILQQRNRALLIYGY